MRFEHRALLIPFLLWTGACGEEAGHSNEETTGDVSGDLNGTTQPDVPTSLVKLSVFKTGDGGVVRSQPAGISCGDACFAEFAAGTVVKLTVEPTNGYRFMGFGGACDGLSPCEVVLDGPKEVGVTWSPFAPELVWSSTAGGSSEDRVTSVAVTPTGDILVAGSTDSSDFSWGETSFAWGGEGQAFFVGKVSKTGDLLWKKEYQASDGSCPGPLIASDPGGNAIVAGYAGSETDLSGALETPSHGAGPFLAQVAADGTVNWYTVFEGGCINVLKIAPDGRIAIGGKVKVADAHFGGESHATSEDATSAFIAVFDAAGLNAWSRVFATQSQDVAEVHDLAFGQGGEITFVAFFQNTGNVSFGGDPLPDGHANVIAHYSVEGTHLWSRPFGGVFSNPRRITRLNDGTMYIAGWESPGAAQENFIARVSPAGEELERWEFPLEEQQEPVALLPADTGFVFVGRTYDPYEDLENFFLIRLTDEFIVEYSLDLGGTYADIVDSAVLTEDGVLVLGGGSNSLSIAIGDASLTNGAGGKDAASSILLFGLGGLQ